MDHLEFIGGTLVSEMTAGSIVPVDQSKVDSLLAACSDTEPHPARFAIVRIEEGFSGNRRLWKGEVLDSIAEQINSRNDGDEFVGFLGHIPESDQGHAFPEPQTLWLAAKTVVENGKKVLYAKGYNYPDSKIRKYLVGRAANSVSWQGGGVMRAIPGGQEVVKFVLKSIDWSRKGAEGMSARAILAHEMSEGEEMDIGKITKDELAAGNPNLLALLKTEASAESATKIAEMQTQIDGNAAAAETLTRLRQTLGVDEKADLVELVGEMVKNAGESARVATSKRVSAVLSEMVSEKAAKVLSDLMPIGEMVTLSDDDLKKKVGELVSTNETMKTIVSEMDAGTGASNHRGASRGGEGKSDDGKQFGGLLVTGKTNL